MDEMRCVSGLHGSSGSPPRRPVARWLLSMVCALTLGVASAQAQEPPAATAPSGVTNVDVDAAVPAPPPVASPEAVPAPSTPLPPASEAPSTPSVVLVAPASSPESAVLAVVAPPPAAPSPPATPAWSPVFTGSYFSRYELRVGFDDLGISSPTVRNRFSEGDAIFYRVRFGIGTGLLDVGNNLKVALQFTPQTTGTFGNLTSTPGAPNTIADATLGLHEGYARIQGAYARFDAGRFELNYGDALILGNLDWNEIGRTFDGARVRISTSPTSAWLDVFATLIDEGRPDYQRGGTLDNVQSAGFGDVYFLGAYGAFGPAITKGLELDAYALVRSWGELKGARVTPANAMSPLYRRESAAEATIGVRAKQKLGLFDYRFEAGVQSGSRPGAAPNATAMPVPTQVDKVDVTAYHADLELGLSVAQDKFRASVEGIYASGDDPTTRDKNEGFDELFPTAHKFLGLTDAFAQGGIKRTNVASGVLHLTAAPTKSLTVQVDGHVFSRLEQSAQFYNRDGFAGGEVDVGAVLLLAKGLKLRGTYGVFVPDNTLYRDSIPATIAARSADPVHFFECELRYDLMP